MQPYNVYLFYININILPYKYSKHIYILIENSKIKKNNVAINSKTEKILFNQDKYIYIYNIQTIKTRCGLIIYLYIYILIVYTYTDIYI